MTGFFKFAYALDEYIFYLLSFYLYLTTMYNMDKRYMDNIDKRYNIDAIVPNYYITKVCINNRDKPPRCWNEKKIRPIGVSYSIYHHLEPDPNRYCLNAEQNYKRDRVRRHFVYKDKQGNLREKIENDIKDVNIGDKSVVWRI